MNEDLTAFEKKGGVMKGYKCFEKDMTCIGFQYEVGKSFKHEGEIELCGAGFHFCRKPADVFNYYSFDVDNIVCEVEASGKIEHGDDKSVCSEIKILKKLSWHKVLELVNTGKNNAGYRNSGDRNSGGWNSGYRNSGDRNSGDRNSGDRNSGDWNSGGWNSGYRNSGYRNSGGWNSGYWNSGYRNSGGWNSGYWNSGYRNSGYRNSGGWNSGYRNSGDRNSGDRNSGGWNSCNLETGFFNSRQSEKIRVFNEECSIESWQNAEKPDFIYDIKITEWVEDDSKTEGGYLKTYSYKEAWQNAWNKEKEKSNWEEEYNKLINLPNFDKEVFEEITGINIEEDK
jgi:hypothetical protein